MSEIIKVSKCCKSQSFYCEATQEKKLVWICEKCENLCEIEEVCEICLGDGVIDTDETDSDGNVARGVGSAKCICQLSDEEDYNEDDQ